jgi:methylated-DNA-[protein]-cysteine S-methyltransferase
LFIDEPAKITPATDNQDLPPMAIQAVEQLIEYFHGQRRIFELPISQKGTPFQQKVWAELMNIPYGKTLSYLEMAHRLGDPKVIRAAAAANGQNNVAIIVPCHRVIGSNNTLVGYAGGLPRKKYLLQLENKTAHGVQTLF